MSKSIQSLVKFSGVLAVLLSATYSPSKASAQSLLPDISLIEGGQICLALCTSGAPSQPLANPALGQVMQLPGQLLQLPGQILSSQGTSVIRSNPPVLPGGAPMMPPGGVPMMPPPNAPMMMPPPGTPQPLPPGAAPTQPPQPQKTSFLKKIAPALPILVQTLAR